MVSLCNIFQYIHVLNTFLLGRFTMKEPRLYSIDCFSTRYSTMKDSFECVAYRYVVYVLHIVLVERIHDVVEKSNNRKKSKNKSKKKIVMPKW